MTEERFQRLVNAYLDREINSRDLEQLKASLATSPERLKTFYAYMRLHSAEAAVFDAGEKPALQRTRQPWNPLRLEKEARHKLVCSGGLVLALLILSLGFCAGLIWPSPLPVAEQEIGYLDALPVPEGEATANSTAVVSSLAWFTQGEQGQLRLNLLMKPETPQQVNASGSAVLARTYELMPLPQTQEQFWQTFEGLDRQAFELSEISRSPSLELPTFSRDAPRW